MRLTAISAVAGLLLFASGCPSGDDHDGPVTIRVVDGTDAAANVVLLFHDADGVYLDRVQTDVDGAASFDLPAGGSVTAILDPGIQFAETRMGVQRGDTLTFLRDAGPTVTVVVTLPGAYPGATSYLVRGTCGGSSTTDPNMPLTLYVPEYCITDGVLRVAAVPDTPLDPAAYTLAEDVTVDSATVNVTLPAWRTDFDTYDVQVTNADTQATLSSVFGSRVVGGRSLYPISQDTGTPPDWTATLSLPVDAPDAFRFSSTAAYADGAQVSMTVSTDDPVNVVMDHSTMLPKLTAGTPDGSNPAQLVLPWTGTVTGADYGGAFLSWVTGASTAGYWYVAFPPDTESPLALPELPADLSAYYVDPATLDGQLIFYETSFYDGYEGYLQADPAVPLPTSYAYGSSGISY